MIVHFRKIYENIREEGILPHALVAHQKRAWYQSREAVMAYQHRLRLDLWLFTLQFEWVRRVRRERQKEADNQDTAPSTETRP